MMSSVLDKILDTYPDEGFVRWDGLDAAVIGLEMTSMRLVYSNRKIVEELKKQGMSEDDAVEYMLFNISGAYIGEKTPILCETME